MSSPTPAPAELPIGVFDSGLGGLTVVRALRRALPAESIVYLGDTARVPYGTRAPSTVVRYAEGCAKLLLRRHVKALVIACNTASAVALEQLQERLDVPVVGVVEPGARAALAAARCFVREASGLRRIAVLGTEGTVRSGAYARVVAQLAPDYEVVARAAPLFVPLAEEGWLEGEVPERVAERYLAPLVESGARVVVLGCTHYPLLRDVVERVLGRLSPHATHVVDSADATAESVAELLGERGLLARPGGSPRLTLLATDLPESFAAVAERFLGAGLPPVVQVDITDED